MVPAANYKVKPGLNVIKLANAPFPTVFPSLKFKNIRIDPTGAAKYGTYSSDQAYTNDVNAALETVYATQTGRAVMDEMDRLSFTATIRFRGVVDVNAEVDPDTEGAYAPNGVGAQHGTGLGSSVEIYFTPNQLGRFWNVVPRKPAPGQTNWQATRVSPTAGTTPSETLIHEFIHAVRCMEGLFDETSLLGTGYGNEEEFYAIVVANIYASEKGLPGDLRQDHQGFFHLTADTDAAFLPAADLSDYRYATMTKFVRTQPALTSRLALIPSVFNPVHRFKQLQALARTPYGASSRNPKFAGSPLRAFRF